MIHLKTIGILIGSMLGFIVLVMAMTVCFGNNNKYALICFGIFVLFLLIQSYISVYKLIKLKHETNQRNIKLYPKRKS